MANLQIFDAQTCLLINKIEHLGIAVKSLHESNDLMEKLLGISPYKTEAVVSESVNTSFFQLGESKVELLQAIDEEGPIHKYLAKRGEGLHHVALDVTNIEEEIERLTNLGFIVLNPEPKRGADNKKIVFLHPKTTNGVLIELCEDMGEQESKIKAKKNE